MLDKKQQAARIKQLRERAGLSQAEAAEKAGLSVRTLQGMESGRSEPTWRGMCALKRALGVSLDELDREPDGEPTTPARSGPKPQKRAGRQKKAVPAVAGPAPPGRPKKKGRPAKKAAGTGG